MFILKHQLSATEYTCHSCSYYRAVTDPSDGSVTVYAQDDERGVETRFEVGPEREMYVTSRGKTIDVIRPSRILGPTIEARIPTSPTVTNHFVNVKK